MNDIRAEQHEKVTLQHTPENNTRHDHRTIGQQAQLTGILLQQKAAVIIPIQDQATAAQQHALIKQEQIQHIGPQAQDQQVAQHPLHRITKTTKAVLHQTHETALQAVVIREAAAVVATATIQDHRVRAVQPGHRDHTAEDLREEVVHQVTVGAPLPEAQDDKLMTF